MKCLGVCSVFLQLPLLLVGSLHTSVVVSGSESQEEKLLMPRSVEEIDGSGSGLSYSLVPGSTSLDNSLVESIMPNSSAVSEGTLDISQIQSTSEVMSVTAQVNNSSFTSITTVSSINTSQMALVELTRTSVTGVETLSPYPSSSHTMAEMTATSSSSPELIIVSEAMSTQEYSLATVSLVTSDPPTLQSSITQHQSTAIPSSPPTTNPNIYTSTLFLAAAGGAVVVLLIFLLILTCILVACRKRIKRKCSCCRPSHKVEGPIISISYQAPFHGERGSYFIKNNELGPTSSYSRPGEDDASTEFMTTFFVSPTPRPVSEVARRETERGASPINVKFKTLERSWRPSARHQPVEETDEENEDTNNEFRLSDLDNLEKMLDSALIRFESTTL